MKMKAVPISFNTEVDITGRATVLNLLLAARVPA